MDISDHLQTPVFRFTQKTIKNTLLQSATYGLHCRLARLCLRASSRTTPESPMGLCQTADCSRATNFR